MVYFVTMMYCMNNRLLCVSYQADNWGIFLILQYVKPNNVYLSLQWNSTKSVLTIGSGRSAVQYQRTGHGIVSCIGLKSNRKISSSAIRESYHPTTTREADTFSITDYSSSELAEQLTLLDQVKLLGLSPTGHMVCKK